MTFAGAVLFFKTYWKQILIGLAVIALTIYIFSLRSSIRSKEEEIATLKNNIFVVESALKNREDIIKIQEASMEIFNEALEKQKVSEIHYKERVIENKEVIREYVESKRSEEELQKLYDFKNNRWKSINNSIIWWEKE